MLTENPPSTAITPHGRTLAYRHTPGSKPGVIFLGGFMSDMTGSKAMAVEARCRTQGIECTRFDYSGHGVSSGKFEEGCIGDWRDDALFIFDHVTDGKQILVGSSMGGWISLLIATQRPERVSGLIGIAAAADFTESMFATALDPAQQKELLETGITHVKSCYDDDVFPVTKKLLEDGRNHLLLNSDSIDIACPVHLLQGMKDQDVPWQTALEISKRLVSNEVNVTFAKEAAHRFSEPGELSLLCDIVERMVKASA